MSFELQLLLQSFLLPLGVTLVAVVFAWLLEPRLASPMSVVPPTLAFAGWWFGWIISVSTLKQWTWTSENWPFVDPWMLLPWPMLASTCLLVLPFYHASTPLNVRRAILALTITSLFSWLAMPAGNSWKDMLPELPFWMAVVPLSIFSNGLSSEALLKRDANRWGLWILVASLGSLFALALQAYATMAQSILALLAATILIAFGCLLRPRPWGLVLVWPLALAIGTFGCWVRFRNYQPLSTWIYLLVLFTPTLVCSLDAACYQLGLRRTRWLIAALASAIPLSIVIYYSLPQEESW